MSNVSGLKLTYDTANMLVAGEEPKAYYEQFKDHIGYCHLKDVRIAEGDESVGDIMSDGRKMITAIHGPGIIDFKSVLEWFKRDRYDGYLSVEYAADGNKEDIAQVLIGERLYLQKFLKG